MKDTYHVQSFLESIKNATFTRNATQLAAPLTLLQLKKLASVIDDHSMKLSRRIIIGSTHTAVARDHDHMLYQSRQWMVGESQMIEVQWTRVDGLQLGELDQLRIDQKDSFTTTLSN